MINKFESFLRKSDLAKNTVSSYVWTVRYFINRIVSAIQGIEKALDNISAEL